MPSSDDTAGRGFSWDAKSVGTRDCPLAAPLIQTQTYGIESGDNRLRITILSSK